MFLALTLATLWIVFALRRKAPMPIWVLVATGVPLLGLMTLQVGPGPGLLCLAVGAWALRRPLARAWQAAEADAPLRE
jgi:hypothetical protein